MSKSSLVRVLGVLTIFTASTLAVSCGGGGGGPGPFGAGQGLVLIGFMQNSIDNMSISQSLEFRFSEPVNPETITSGSIQVRVGPSFGLAALGTYEVRGTSVFFNPRLPSVCGYADAGFLPGTDFQVVVVGYPEEFAIKNTKGQSLDATQTYNFTTLPETDPEFLTDQLPGVLPRIVSVTPSDGTPGVAVAPDNEIVVEFSEHIDPCSITAGGSVKLLAAELGDRTKFLDPPSGTKTGFDPVVDQAPANAFSWGANGTALAVPYPLSITAVLDQTAERTLLRVKPILGRFPENCLVVLDLGSGIRDFGGSPLAASSLSFTTENLPSTEANLRIEFDATTPIDPASTTADVNSTRSPGLTQGWVSFGGDGDNGPAPMTIPSFPIIDDGDGTLIACDTRINDGNQDDFSPTVDTILSTGTELLPSSCTNGSDGSQAVVFEFATFHIGNGITVKIEGVNPCIILVRGAVTIDAGGLLDARGAKGGNGQGACQPGGSAGKAGPGAGPGGVGGYQSGSPGPYAGDGTSGTGTAVPFDAPGEGGGVGGVNAIDPPGWGGSGVGGGGGGHATMGAAGASQLSGTGAFAWAASPVKGDPGDVYPATDDRLLLPSAGSGGAGGGCQSWTSSWSTGGCVGQTGTGGGGGGGGGFVGITASGDITISGAILASGGNGGNGGAAAYSGGGGGGGGSGGGVRLLTPGKIILTAASVISTAGGQGGAGNKGNYGNGGGTQNAPHYANGGGDGGIGRIVLEDGDSVIDGLSTATLFPTEGEDGFFRGPFDSSRFVSGGTQTVATTLPMALGPILDPAAATLAPLTAADFSAAIPDIAIPSGGQASIVLELQGFLAKSDGTVDATTASGWYTVGYFSTSGIVTQPTWTADASPAGWTPDAGVGIGNLSGQTVFVQARVTFNLSTAMGPEDAGPWLDFWRIRYTADQ
jgi:hypothetical protein